MKNFVIIIISILSLTACNLIDTNIETNYKIRTAYKYPDQVAITKDDLKNKLQSDTSHYKIVILYSVSCDGCETLFSETISKIWANTDTSQVKWYFIQVDCGSLKWNSQFLKKYGITTTMYYFKNNGEKGFSSFNPQKMNNLANYIFDTQSMFDKFCGVPVSFIVNKNGLTKIHFYKYADSTLRQGSFGINMLKQSIEKINFQTADTSFLNYNDDIPEIPVCTNHKCNHP